MKNVAEQLVLIMAANKRRHRKYWNKLRVDRIGKLVPEGTNVDELLDFLVKNDIVKLTRKEDDFGNLVPAIQLKHKQFLESVKDARYAKEARV